MTAGLAQGDSRGWHVVPLRVADEVRTFAAASRDALKITEFQHDIEWLEIERGSEHLSVVANADEMTVRGMLVSRISKSLFKYEIGGFPIVTRRVHQYTIHQGPLTTQSEARREIEAAFSMLHNRMETGAVAYASAVPLDSPTYAALTDKESAVRKAFLVLAWGKPCPHFKIKWEGTVARYLASLNGKRRANVRRAAEKLTIDAHIEFKKFVSPLDVDRFLADALQISEKANEARDEPVDLVAGSAREALIRFAAAREQFVGYVLYAAGTPIAYRYGFIYGTTFFAISTGYNPAYADLKPGAAIFLEMLRDFEKSKLPVTLIDLLPHVNSFKRERANHLVQAQNFYLFKHDLRGYLSYLPLVALERLKSLATSALSYMGARQPAPRR